MVSLFEEDKGNFGEDPINDQTLLASIKSWYPNGVQIGIEGVYPFKKPNDYGKTGFTIRVTPFDMEKCRARVIGNDGKPVMMEDAMGNMVQEITTTDEIGTVAIFVRNIEILDNGNFKVKSMGAAYEFINPIFIASGDVPEGNRKGIEFTPEEFIEAAEGLELTLKCGKNPKSNRLHPVAII